MRNGVGIGAVALMALVVLAVSSAAHEKGHLDDLPAGPIRDRHELMEGIGKDAKALGAAMKAGDNKKVAAQAQKIQTASKKILALFPPGSTDPKSRAKPEIWTDWAKFETNAKNLDANAGALAAAASSGGDVKGASQTLFGTCKSCHDAFRTPDKDD